MSTPAIQAEPAPIQFESLRTDRLLLRPLAAADRPAYLHMHRVSAEHTRRWTPGRPPGETLDQFFDRQVKRAADGLTTGTALRLCAFDDASAIVGGFALNNITRGAGQYADAGWMVSAEHVGRGYATEGVWALLDLAFAPPPRGLGLHRVQANVIPENARSLRVAAKCGFRVEGLARAMLLINEQWHDHVMHAKLTGEHRPKYVF